MSPPREWPDLRDRDAIAVIAVPLSGTRATCDPIIAQPRSCVPDRSDLAPEGPTVTAERGTPLTALRAPCHRVYR